MRNKSYGILKFILPHHAFYWTVGALIVFGAGFLVVFVQDVSIDSEVNKLADGHVGVDTDGFDTGDYEGPGVAVADVAFPCSGVDVDT